MHLLELEHVAYHITDNGTFWGSGGVERRDGFLEASRLQCSPSHSCHFSQALIASHAPEINYHHISGVHRMNSKVRLLQVDERRESSGGSVAVLHSKTTEGWIIVRLLGSLKNQPSIFPETPTIYNFIFLPPAAIYSPLCSSSADSICQPSQGRGYRT